MEVVQIDDDRQRAMTFMPTVEKIDEEENSDEENKTYNRTRNVNLQSKKV